VKTVRLGAGMAFWGDNIRAAVELVERGGIDYLCCDHLAELTMSILGKQRDRDPRRGYTRDVLDLMRAALPTALEKGVRIVTNAGGANPRACGEAVADIARELGVEVKIAVVTGDDIRDRLDDLMSHGVPLANMETGQPLSDVRDRITHANVYTGSEGIVEALAAGADVVICGRVTDVALYIGPLIHELGWAPDDWHLMGIAAAAAHAAECGGQATGGLLDGGWQDVPGMEAMGYPIAEVSEDGTVVITKPDGTGGQVSVASVSEQMVYEIHDPRRYLTADVTGDFGAITLTEVGPDRVELAGVTGHEAPETLKVNIGYRAGFVGEVQFTYTWPDAYAKAQRGLEFLKERLKRADFQYDDERVEYVGVNSMFGDRVAEPDDPELGEIVVRYAARCQSAEEAGKVFTQSVPLYNNGPAGVAGIGTRPPLKELYALWPCLIPRELVSQEIEMVEVRGG
jgi:hypothetical protein